MKDDKVGFNCSLTLDNLNAAALFAAESENKYEMEVKLQKYLFTTIKSESTRVKVRRQLVNLWYGKNDHKKVYFFINKAKEFISNVDANAPFEILWGLLIARSSFFSDVVNYMGRVRGRGF